MAVNVLKEPLVVPSQVVGVTKQQGKRIVKMFLSDSSINANGRAIAKEAQDSIMKTVIGKPYLIPPFLDHPQRPQPYPPRQEDDIALIHKTAKPYEGGIVYDLERVNSEDNPGYNAFVELTSTFAIKLFDEGLLPRFVSHSIYKLNPNEPDSEMRSAVVNNICAVRKPAYGPKARVLGMCVGDREDCKTGLREASEEINDEKCATMKAVETLEPQDRFEFSNDLLKDLEQKSSNMSETAGSTTSTTTTEFPRSGRKVVQDSAGNVISDTHPPQKTDQSKSVKAEAQQDQEVTKKEEKKTETETKEETTKDKDAPIKEPPKKASDNPDNNNNNENKDEEDKPEDVVAKSRDPNERIGSLETMVKNLGNSNSELKKETRYYRKKIIETKVNSATYLKPEVRAEHVEKWEKSPLIGEDLEFALTTAYDPQTVSARSPDREKKSSIGLHEDDTDSEKTSSSRPKKDNDGKLTLDLLTRR